VIRQFTHREKLSIRFYLEAGLLEVADSPSLLHSNRHLRDVLEAKGYVVHYSEYNGRHDHINWRGSLSQGLMALFGSPSRQTNHRTGAAEGSFASSVIRRCFREIAPPG
jgi:hypothetical protein